ncbi:MAG: HEAT repeat domain-containing protein [Armatimonadetes bacterium]|nr:HEAT repeat domain-containing protein [Armatimonadota bacterium]
MLRKGLKSDHFDTRVNAATAMLKSGERDFFVDLLPLLESDRGKLYAIARETVPKLTAEEILMVLDMAVKGSKRAMRALDYNPHGYKLHRELFQHDDPDIRVLAIRLGTRPEILSFADDPEPKVRAIVAGMLSGLRPHGLRTETYMKLLDDADPDVRYAAVKNWQVDVVAGNLTPVLERFDDPEPRIRRRLLYQFSRFASSWTSKGDDPDQVLDLVERALKDEAGMVRQAATTVLLNAAMSTELGPPSRLTQAQRARVIQLLQTEEAREQLRFKCKIATSTAMIVEFTHYGIQVLSPHAGLALSGDRSAYETIVKLTEGSWPETAFKCLSLLDDPRVAEMGRRMVKDAIRKDLEGVIYRDYKSRQRVSSGFILLARQGDETDYERLLSILLDESLSLNLRSNASFAILKAKPRSCYEIFARVAVDTSVDLSVRKELVRWLGNCWHPAVPSLLASWLAISDMADLHDQIRTAQQRYKSRFGHVSDEVLARPGY